MSGSQGGHRLSYYFEVYRESAKLDYVCDAEDHKAYIEIDRLSKLTEVSADVDLCSRARKIREMQPRHVVES